MPPKKKANVTPIVVGTVSTRSTRRQSVVNIEIPRLSKKRTHSKELKLLLEGSKIVVKHVDDEDSPAGSQAPNKIIKDILDDWSEKDTDASDSELNPLQSECEQLISASGEVVEDEVVQLEDCVIDDPVPSNLKEASDESCSNSDKDNDSINVAKVPDDDTNMSTEEVPEVESEQTVQANIDEPDDMSMQDTVEEIFVEEVVVDNSLLEDKSEDEAIIEEDSVERSLEKMCLESENHQDSIIETEKMEVTEEPCKPEDKKVFLQDDELITSLELIHGSKASEESVVSTTVEMKPLEDIETKEEVKIEEETINEEPPTPSRKKPIRKSDTTKKQAVKKIDDRKTKPKSKSILEKLMKKVTKPAKDKPKSNTVKDKKPAVEKPKPVKEVKTPKKVKKKPEPEVPKKTENDDEDSNEIRRSSRIKSISVLKKKTKGHGLVRSKSESNLNEGENSENSNSGWTESEASASPMVREKSSSSRSRWTRSTENINSSDLTDIKLPNLKPKLKQDKEVETRLKQFVHLKENLYLTDRLACKEAKKMVCDCFLTEEEINNGDFGCGDDCLNRLLMIECGPLCPIEERCTNKRFQKIQFAPVEVFNTEKKGLGLRAAANIPYGEFILEYVGEVLDPDEFEERAEHYSADKNIHYYFMSLRADAIIDATAKGNISRFINHSCDPNAETQKWTVNGELRIGFFSTRTILAGEEITFDYRFQRYGKEAQRCHCESSICRGWLGERPESSDEEEEEEDEELEKEKPTVEEPTPEVVAATKQEEVVEEIKIEDAPNDLQLEEPMPAVTPLPVVEKKSPKKKPRKEMFEDLDQLEEEIDVLVETGLKNQAHTLKLSRLMVRAKDLSQRAKLLRVLRRGELACRRLFLDYHGLRLMHGYMIDAQQPGKKFEQSRLEMLQTLAMLPIPNKTMLQDSKVLSTVENWSIGKGVTSPDSDSNSPTDLQQAELKNKGREKQMEDSPEEAKSDEPNVEEEIVALALKLLEEWSSLKEVFRIPKKERIEQMKEHEREANKKYMMNAERDVGNRLDNRKYLFSRSRHEKDFNKKKADERERALSMYKITKQERRKLFALQVELREEERRRKQREMWMQHEQNCLLIGADPRMTAPFDPTRGFQYVWNPQIGQWQNIPIPAPNNMFVARTNAPPGLPNLSVPPPQITKPNYGYNMPLPQLPALNQPPPMAYPTNPPPSNLTPTVPPLPYQTPPPLPTIPPPVQKTVAYQEPVKKIEESYGGVKFMGPIPPPVKLPPKWKCAKDKYGRPYYYHVKIRKSQWEPPPYVEPQELPESSESSSSTESSSVSSDTSSDNSDSDDEIDDTRLLLEVRKQMEKSAKLSFGSGSTSGKNDSASPSPEDKVSEDNEEEGAEEEDNKPSSIDIRLKEQFDLLSEDKPSPAKKRRTGLVQEIIISPRTEEDRLQFREDLKRYKYNKEKLRREREIIVQQTRKQLRETDIKKVKDKKVRTTVKSRIKEMSDFNSEHAKKIKETFRSNMATTVVSVLNAYRKPDCMEARITNTEDFKHLARKLTHFVMLKEMKHIAKIEDLTCTDNVKTKAREYIRKYMSKFGEVYQKRPDEPDFKD